MLPLVTGIMVSRHIHVAVCISTSILFYSVIFHYRKLAYCVYSFVLLLLSDRQRLFSLESIIICIILVFFLHSLYFHRLSRLILCIFTLILVFPVFYIIEIRVNMWFYAMLFHWPLYIYIHMYTCIYIYIYIYMYTYVYIYIQDSLCFCHRLDIAINLQLICKAVYINYTAIKYKIVFIEQYITFM
jgi:hypothetical protein